MHLHSEVSEGYSHASKVSGMFPHFQGFQKSSCASEVSESSCTSGTSETLFILSEVAIKTGFTLEVTPRKSRVEGGWDLASPYVVHPCLHTQWSRILELVRGGDKDLSQGVNKPVRVGPSRLSE